MLSSVTLQNFRSFGREQTVPLEPITVLVGPNNSGKSSFIGFSRFVREAAKGPKYLHGAVETEGGLEFLLHRPAIGDKLLRIAWANSGTYSVAYRSTGETLQVLDERASGPASGSTWVFKPSGRQLDLGDHNGVAEGLGKAQDDPVRGPVTSSRLLKLDVGVLRADTEVVPQPTLATNGDGLAAVLGLWRGNDSDESKQLDHFLQKCVPEIRAALVKPSPQKNYQRLWFRQTDGEEFDAAHASDGLLAFTAIAMNIIDAPKGAVLFIEEPEHSIHPSRLVNLVELMRTAVHERGCQFVLATHSPVLLNELSNDPSRIVLFRRGPEGTEVKRCTEVPGVEDQLQRLAPGELLATAFFESAWPR
jgi:predicted ATPase